MKNKKKLNYEYYVFINISLHLPTQIINVS